LDPTIISLHPFSAFLSDIMVRSFGSNNCWIQRIEPWFFSFLKNIFINVIKFILLFVNFCSKSPFYLFFVLATMIVFFSNRNQNYLVNFCQSFVLFLLLFSIILFIIYNIRTPSSFVLNLLGLSFIDKNFLPSKNGVRAKFPALIFAPTIFVFLLIDYASLAFFDHLHNVKIGEITQEMKKLYSEGQGF